jgi:hypothetical protein
MQQQLLPFRSLSSSSSFRSERAECEQLITSAAEFESWKDAQLRAGKPLVSPPSVQKDDQAGAAPKRTAMDAAFKQITEQHTGLMHNNRSYIHGFCMQAVPLEEASNQHRF